MFRQIVVVALIALLIINSEALCPCGIRIVNAGVPSPASIDLVVNNVALATNIGFRSVTKYFSLSPGSKSVVIRQTSSGSQIATRSFVAVPNVYYTVALTGAISGPVGELLVNTSPFVYRENIYPPNPGKFRGTFHRLSETTGLRQLSVRTQSNTNNVVVPSVQAKTAVYYPEVDSGSISFTVQNLIGQTVLNSLNNPTQLNTTVNSGVLLDIFEIGDNSNTQNPTQLAQIQSTPAFDSNSGCTLVDGIVVLPDNTPVAQVSFTPVFCSASSLATGIAFLLALVALFF
jgi:hypothetical protein